MSEARRRPRILDEIRFVVGAALIGALAGALVAAFALPPGDAGIPTAPFVSRWLHATAPAIGFGWWGALIWSVALAAHARRYQPPVTIARLARAAWLAAGLTVVGGLCARLLGQRPGWGVLAGIVIGSLVARFLAARR
jgi:hypothetical protein